LHGELRHSVSVDKLLSALDHLDETGCVAAATLSLVTNRACEIVAIEIFEVVGFWDQVIWDFLR